MVTRLPVVLSDARVIKSYTYYNVQIIKRSV